MKDATRVMQINTLAGTIAPVKIMFALFMILTHLAICRGQAVLRPAIAHMSWTQRDGAPMRIAALAETTDGYLWVGSPLGLYRFDGVEFSAYPMTPLDKPLPSADVESLAADQKGGLWIGFRLGGVSFLSRDGVVTDYNRRNGRGPGEVQKLLCRDDGSVWAIGDGKLLTLKDQHWTDFGKEHGLPEDELYTFYFDRAGNLWTAARQKIFVLIKSESRFSKYLMESFAVVDFAETPDGRLWVSDAWHSIHTVGLKATSQSIEARGLARIAVEPLGIIWIAQDYRGVSHVSATDPTHVVRESAASEQTESILRDRDGNIWVGSSLGLDRFQPSTLQSLAGLRLEYYPSLAADPHGGVWVATHENSMLHVTLGTPKKFGPSVGSSPLVCDEQGRAWLVDPVLHELVSYSGSVITRTPNPPETNLMVAQSIGLDLDGSPLVDFLTKGLWRYDGAWHRIADPAMPDDDVLSIFRAPDKRVWLGFADGHIVMRDADGFHAFSVGEGAPLGNVLAFVSYDGKLWAGGTNGLAYFDGLTFHRITLRNGMALRGVSGVVEDKAHNLWLNAQAGLVRIDAREIQQAMQHSDIPLAFEILDQRHGLSGSATQLKPTPSAIAENDGTLVFSTDGNVFFLDPSKVSFRRSPPQTMIETISVNGIIVADREHPLSQIKVNAGSLNSLAIGYIGVDLVSPEKVTYRYRLEGEDKDWQQAGVRRQAFYNHIYPGTYQFHLAAASGENSLAELSPPLLLIVSPAFYQSTWFYVLCTLVVLSLIYVAYLIRVQYVTNRLRERLRERSSERIRIARELHDTLLQAIHGLMLRFHFATEALPEDEPARQSLQMALSRADEVILEGRRRVQDLREESSGAADFATQIAALAIDVEIQKAMEFCVTENGQPQELASDVCKEMCGIAREALTNMLHHSKAKRADITLSYCDTEFIMRCCDNGVGLTPATLSHGRSEGHWGLVGMRERAAMVEGRLQLWSSPGRGTEIEIHIPGRRAYNTLRPATRWFRSLSQLRRDAEGGDGTL